MNTFAEQFTEQFYLWEQRGRGWKVWDAPVELEPPFIPFAPRFVIDDTPKDDGRKPTYLSSLVEKTIQKFSGNIQESQPVSETIVEELYEPTPDLFSHDGSLREIAISLPREEKLTPERIDHFIVSLSRFLFPVSFEVLGTSQHITVQFTCLDKDAFLLQTELRAYFPGITIEVKEGAIKTILEETQEMVVVDFGLSEEFMRPLKNQAHIDPDSLLGIVTALDTLRFGEAGMLQVLFQATRNPWTQSMLSSVLDRNGDSIFENAPEMAKLVREKISRPLFACVIRVIGAGPNATRAWEIARLLGGGLRSAAYIPSNELIPLTNENYDIRDHFEDVLRRESHRSGMILNSGELATLVHPLSPSVVSSKLSRISRKTKPAPHYTQGHATIVGINQHLGKHIEASLSIDQRLKHMHVIGATGTGKSTLLHNLIVQDLEQGHGLAIIDPHGDLIERVISYIPRRRFKDVILFDPSDTENPVGINILSAKGEAEKNVAASDLVAVFQRLSTSWGDQMTVVLGNAIQAFLESSQGGTLLDLRMFLIEESFRKEFLKTVNDPDVRYYWEKQHHLLRGNTLGPLLTRLDSFLRPKIIRRVIAPKTELHFTELLNERKILLMKLAQGLMGEENSTLLGTLIVSKLHQAAMARQAQKANERSPFFLYIDEFQNFITPSLSGVLSGTRKYGLGLILAHQELRQIFNQDTGVGNSLIANPGTRICFRLGDIDAEKLQSGFTHFTAHDLQNLGMGEAIMRVEKSEDDFNLKITPLPTVNPETAKSRRKKLIELSHMNPESAEKTEQAEEGIREDVAPSTTQNIPEPVLKYESEYSEEKRSIESVTPSLSDEPITLAVPREDKSLSQHRYLQALIKRMAEERGYRSVIEEPTPDGEGRVDVGLEHDGERIACEISVTTSEEHELQNIEKCLRAGYHKVIMCGLERKRLGKIEILVKQKLNIAEQSKILFFEPDGLFLFLHEQGTESLSLENKVKGYRVNVRYQDVHESDQKQMKDSVAKVILQSLKRMKDSS